MNMTETLPAELLKTGLFCCWRREEKGGSTTKVPYNPRSGGLAQSNNPATFAPLEMALSASVGYDGLGVGVFGSLGAIDLDRCIDEEGAFSELASDIMQIMGSYTEKSPSGRGVRIFFKATDFRYDKAQFYIMNKALGLEIYIAGCTNKFVTCTGDVIADCGYEERGVQLLQVLEKYMVRPKHRAEPALPPGTVDMEDMTLIEKAKRSKGGAAFSALWAGDITGYPSHSEADIALCNALAWWTGRDADRVNKLFRKSGLMRDKWDRPQSGSTYGAITVQNAIEACTHAYNPQQYRRAAAIKAFGKAEELAEEQKICEGVPISMDIVRMALRNLKITVRHNVLLKDTEIKGLPDHYSAGNATNILPIYLMDYLKSCDIKGATLQAIEGYLGCIADENRFNPIEELLTSVKWDGVDRLDQIYRILGVSEPKYRTYIRKWLIQCISLGLNDEEWPMGAEGVLVLQGEQGLAKTSFFRVLVPNPRWFCEGAVIDVADKDTLLKALAAWITELGELDSTLKREQSALKAFITSPEDRIRAPYARNATRASRRTSFCGTVNPADYLRDETGSRRFWTIPVASIDKRALFSLPHGWATLLWAQMYKLYQENPNGFRLTDAEMRQLQEDNASFAVPLPYEMEIRELLDYSIPHNEWQWWKAKEIRKLLPASADAVRVGKALKKVVEEQKNHFSCLQPSPPKNTRIVRGATEYFIPLKLFSPKWVERVG